jgi:hypothetical protein
MLDGLAEGDGEIVEETTRGDEEICAIPAD